MFPDAGNAVDDLSQKLDDWYEALPNWKQEAFADVYNQLSQGLENISETGENSTISYQMNKESVRPVNLIIGGQWQISPEWQLRGEAQIFGDRFMGLLSINYRFGVKGHNLFAGQP